MSVATDELALIVAPDHPLAAKKIISVRELGAEAFIAHNVPSPYREKVIKTFAKARTPLNISMEMPTLEAIKRLVENGLGVALIPRLAAQIEIERKQLAGVTVREMRLERRMHLIYRRGGSLSHAAKAFLRSLATALGSDTAFDTSSSRLGNGSHLNLVNLLQEVSLGLALAGRLIELQRKSP